MRTVRRLRILAVVACLSGCGIVPATFGEASVAIDATVPVDPESSVVHLVVNERACASGRAPEGRAIRKSVNQTADEVAVQVEIAGVRGGADCPSNPWHPITIDLDEPLGDRTLIDSRTGQPLGKAVPGEHG